MYSLGAKKVLFQSVPLLNFRISFSNSCGSLCKYQPPWTLEFNSLTGNIISRGNPENWDVVIVRTRVHIFSLFIFQLFSSDYDYSLLSVFLVVYIFEGGLSSVLITNFISDMQHNSIYPPGSISVLKYTTRVPVEQKSFFAVFRWPTQ